MPVFEPFCMPVFYASFTGTLYLKKYKGKKLYVDSWRIYQYFINYEA
jgi:hypothetical protein